MTAPFDVLTELYVDGAWTDISADVLHRDGHSIKRGKSEYASQASPSTLDLSLKNTAGKYSPRNPLSPYFGKIGRNTPIRVSRQVDPVYDAVSSTSGTGDLSWTHTTAAAPTGVLVYVWQYDTNAGQINSVTYGGVPMTRVIFGLFTMGAFQAVGYAYWLNRDIPAGAQTVVVDTTAVKNRYASAITVTGGETAEIEFTTTAYSSATPTTNPNTTKATAHRSIIFGTLLSDLDDGSTIAPQGGYTQLDELDIGTETVNTDRTTLVLPPALYSIGWTQTPAAHWGIMGVAVRAVSYRFWGEASSFPPKWDLTSTANVWVPLEAAGQLRRLGQGTDPAETGLKAFITPQPGLFRYWPLDGAAGTQFSLDIAPVWGQATNVKFRGEGGGGNFQYGQSLGSDYLGTGMAFFNSDAWPMRGDVATGYPNWAFDFVWQQLGNMGGFAAVMYDYNGANWQLTFVAGVAQVSFDDGVTGPIGFSPTGVLPELLDTLPHHCRLKLLKNGANTDWTLYIDGAVVDSGTQPGYTVGGLSIFRLYENRLAGQQYINLAHIAVWADATSEVWPSAAAVSAAAQGYAGEAAGTRIQRICALAAIPVALVGDPADTTLMGPQHSESKLTQIRDAESTDLGIMGEPRDRPGLLYRTRTSLYNQAPAATLDYSAKQLAPPLEPVDDDAATHNDITASRRDGGSVRLQDTTSRLSILDPPLGVGRYKDEVTLNVQTDDQLPGVAAWLLHLGTLDEARFPSVTVNLRADAITSNPALAAALLAVDIGDRLVITGAAAVNIYDDVSLLVLGYSENLSPFEHKITFNCVPESPYNVAAYGSGVGTGPDRYDTDGSALNSGITTTGTSLSVSPTGPAGVLWTTTAGEFPFDIRVGGERMTVTNITSATAPQTFTVTRSVNGVVKAHLAGAAVALWNTPRYAL